MTPAETLSLREGDQPLLLPRRPVRKILLPTDFSPLSLEPLGLASELARATGAELHFLWVDVFGAERPENTEFPTAEEVGKAHWRASPTKLMELLEGREDVEVVHATERAIEVGPAIALYADEHEIDLVVMATKGRTGITRYLMGSVTEQVVRYAPCSVLVVGPQADRRPASDPPRILSAVDFSDLSLEAARLARDLAESLQAEHTVVHAVAQPPAPSFYALDQTLTSSVWDDISRRSEKELEKFAEEDLRGASWEVRTGGAVAQILEAAREKDADLLVVGSHGLTGLPRLLLGSVAEKVVRVAAVPVLVVRPASEDED